MPRTLWDQLYDIENRIRAKNGQPTINHLAGSPYIDAARKRAEQEKLSKLICDGLARFTAVGPGQALRGTGYARDEEHRKPQFGEVAIGGEDKVGLTRKRLRDGADKQIKIYPHCLDQILKDTGGPTPPFTVGDIGNKVMRDSPDAWFDIYRFPTLKAAREFGNKVVPTTVEMPIDASCPPGMIPRK